MRLARLHARSPGFTLVELLLAVAIIGVLSMAVLPLAEISSTRAKEQTLRSALWEIRAAIDAYKAAADAGRIAIAEGASGYPPSLEALVAGVDDAKQPGRKIYFLRRIPEDPFSVPTSGNASSTGWGLRSYDSSPSEPRAGVDVYDVYSLSSRKGSNGVPLRQW